MTVRCGPNAPERAGVSKLSARLKSGGVGPNASREIDDDVICDDASTNVDAKVLNVGLGV